MNIEQFLSQQPIDKLIHQYFSIQGNSDKSISQSSTLINSIVLYIASTPSFTFSQLYLQCQYQLQVNNQQRDAINKLCKLLTGVINKASYLLKNIHIDFFTNQVLQFFLGKVFVTICSADCIKCIWALIYAYGLTHQLNYQISKNSKEQDCCGSNQQGCGSSNKQGCCSTNKSQMINENQQSTNNQSSCCKSKTQPLFISSIISDHQKICQILIKKLLNTFKLHVKAYNFKVRKDIFKLINYILRFVKFSQQHLIKSFKKQVTQLSKQSIKPLLVQIGLTKQQLIELTIKNLCDQKDPRNMHLIFQNYLLLIDLFSTEIQLFNHRTQIFQSIQVYYPLSMQGDQQGFKIDSQDQFNQNQLKQLLDQCLLHQLFRNQVRQLLIQKMSAPPIHQYASLYVKFINKFNPSTFKFTKQCNLEEQRQKYSILTMNLLNRLCEEEYLDQNYEDSCSGDKSDGHCQDSSCGTKKKKSNLISSIIRNVFISTNSHMYLTYSQLTEQKFIEFLNNLIIQKLFNHQQNMKHAGTIIDIVKTILNPGTSNPIASTKAPSTKVSSTKAVTQSSNSGGCCGGGGCGSQSNGGGCGTQGNGGGCESQSSGCCQQDNTPMIKLSYGQKLNYEQILVNFIIVKFMHFWSAKGEVAFKLGLLIIALNKKLQSVSIQKCINSQLKDINDQWTQNTLQHLLITLGNVYETYKQVDQIRIMVLKVLMIMSSTLNKLHVKRQQSQKNINKIRKINNSMIHKDCIKLTQLLKVNRSQQAQTNQQNNQQNKQSRNNKKQQNKQQNNKKQQNPFIKCQQPILKSYIDYLMQIYVQYKSQSEIIQKQATDMLSNMFQSFKYNVDYNNFKSINNQINYFNVKLYAAVRYLALQSSNQLQSLNSYIIIIQPIQHILNILFSNNQQITHKLISLLKYYTYPVLLSFLTLIFKNITILSNKFNDLNSNSQYDSFFINISLVGKVLSQKFDEYYVVQMQNYINYGTLVFTDIKKSVQNNIKIQSLQQSRLSKILLWYMFKKIWRRQPHDKLQISFAQRSNNQSLQNKSIQQKFIYIITSEAIQRISSFMTLYSNQNNYEQITFNRPELPDLQSSMLYVKYLKVHKRQNQLRFNRKLVQLYDPTFIQYFWTKLLNSMTYKQKSMISQQLKKQLIQLIEYLPQNILVQHSQKIAPIIIYTTVIDNKSKMIQQNKQNMLQNNNNIDRFDYTKTQLISKLSSNLPQSSLIIYVIPYCIRLIKQSAISCQKNIQINKQLISPQQSIHALLNINSIIHTLIQKSQQKLSQKKYKYQKLRKSLFQNHKKQLCNYFSRLIYHKKRIIRQSSRNLLMAFQ